MVYLQFHVSNVLENGVQPMNAHTSRVKPRIEPFLFGIPIQLHGKPWKLQVDSIQASTNQLQQI